MKIPKIIDIMKIFTSSALLVKTGDNPVLRVIIPTLWGASPHVREKAVGRCGLRWTESGRPYSALKETAFDAAFGEQNQPRGGSRTAPAANFMVGGAPNLLWRLIVKVQSLGFSCLRWPMLWP